MPPLANRPEAFAVTVAPNTPQASATTTSLVVADGYLQRVEITVPDGHNGLTGIRILSSNSQLVPFTQNTYLVANDQTLTFDLVGAIDTGNFQAQAFNGGLFQHTFYVRLFMLDFAQVPDLVNPVAPVTVPVVV